MTRTNCIIEGRTFPVKYQKTSGKDGQSYQGIIFLQHAVGFSFVRKDSKTVLFEPSFFDIKKKEGIINSIEENERKSDSFNTAARNLKQKQ